MGMGISQRYIHETQWERESQNVSALAAVDTIPGTPRPALL